MAHDLLAPLARIKAASELLSTEISSGGSTEKAEIVARLLHVIDRAATTMEKEIRALLNATLPEGGTSALGREPVDLGALVREIVAAHQATILTHTIQVVTPPSPVVGYWDGLLLTRVLTNLLDNAVKYTPAGGSITVMLRESQRGAVREAILSVQDTGIGISAADLPRVRGAFQRGANVGPGRAGAGIGLASAEGIVRRHGGQLSIQSELGVGTLVTIQLPLNPLVESD